MLKLASAAPFKIGTAGLHSIAAGMEELGSGTTCIGALCFSDSAGNAVPYGCKRNENDGILKTEDSFAAKCNGFNLPFNDITYRQHRNLKLRLEGLSRYGR
jgi:hypothetical protein